MTNHPARSVYDIVTDRILALLDQGTIPWQRPWRTAEITRPVNIRGTAYRGINRVILSAMGYDSPVWLTFKQSTEHGGHVRKGEHGTPVVFWRFTDETTTDDDGDEKTVTRAMARFTTAFNIGQTENVTIPDRLADAISDHRRNLRNAQPIEAAERIVASYQDRPAVNHGGDRAYYQPSTDTVVVPAADHFLTDAHYYHTLFHELGHSTGHPSRLARKGITDPVMFGSHTYSQEELVAELTASFLCAEAAIDQPTVENAAAYIASWLRVLANDRRMVVYAAAQAQKAADHILGAAGAQGVSGAEPLAA